MALLLSHVEYDSDVFVYACIACSGHGRLAPLQGSLHPSLLSLPI